MTWRACLRAIVIGAALAAGGERAAHASIGSACENPTTRVCGAGNLPRVTSREWAEDDVRRFVERALARGTTAVALTTEGGHRRAKMLPACTLPGAYTEVRTRPGSGRLWATNRVLLLVGEVNRSACAEATHLVAAFARAASGPVTFSAVLVPLPCPPVADDAVARGCVGAGLAGSDRVARTTAAIKELRALPVGKVGVAEFLEVYALAPDDEAALGFLSQPYANTECTLYDHADWVGDQYQEVRAASGEMVMSLLPPDDPVRRANMPTLDVEEGVRSCIHHPVFRRCFPGLAEPVEEPWRCWEPAPVAAQPGGKGAGGRSGQAGQTGQAGQAGRAAKP